MDHHLTRRLPANHRRVAAYPSHAVSELILVEIKHRRVLNMKIELYMKIIAS